jgi:plastocyanin
MRKGMVTLLALGVVVLLTATACSKSSSSDESTKQITLAGGDKANDHGTKDVSGKSSVDEEADDFYFESTILKGTAGQKVTLKIDNEGKATHNFSISGQSIDQDISAGQDAEVTVTFPQSGTLEFFCKFHKSQGMAGELQVA